MGLESGPPPRPSDAARSDGIATTPILPGRLGNPFSFAGRLGRGNYGLALLIMVGLTIVLALVEREIVRGLDGTKIGFFLIVTIWLWFAATIRRLRDAGWSDGAAVVLSLITFGPPLGLFMIAYGLFRPSVMPRAEVEATPRM